MTDKIFNTNICISRRFEAVGDCWRKLQGFCSNICASEHDYPINSFISRSATLQSRAENKMKDAGTFKYPIMRIIQVTIPHSGGEHITALGLDIPEVEEFILLSALDCPCPCSSTAGCRSIQSDWFLMFLLFTISWQD